MLGLKAATDKVGLSLEEIELPDKDVAQSLVINKWDLGTNLKSHPPTLPIEN